MLACNNEPKNNTETNALSSADKSTGNDASEQAPAFAGNFPFLAIPKKTLDSLFNNPVKSKKVVFTFQFDNSQAAPSLAAYGIKGKKFLANTPQYTLLKLSITINVPGEYYLGNLELTDNQYDVLKADGGYGSSSHLLFLPKVSTTFPKSITYRTGWGNPFIKDLSDTAKARFTDDDLKPSPPAKPGDDN